MVVGDDDIHAELAGPRDGLGRRDAAVDGQQQARAGRRELLDARDRDAVAVLEATGQEGLDLGAEQAEHLHRERRRADAVDVVVAVDDDAAAGGDRALDERAGLRHVPERERVVQRAVAVQEGARAAGVGQAAPDEHLGGDALKTQLGRELAHALGAAGRDRERRGHPANLGPGPDAAPREGQAWTSTCRMRPSSSRSRGAGPW